MMTLQSVRLLPIALCFVSFALDGAEPAAFTPVDFSVERSESSKLRLTFPGAENRRYQVYASQDLRNWEFASDLIRGRSRLITVEQSITNETRNFFRVEARPVSFPVTTRILRETVDRLTVSFSSLEGRNYQAWASADLVEWSLLGDLGYGTGLETVADWVPTEGAYHFLRFESVDVVPLPSMVWIKSGTFVMGSPADEKDREPDEEPLTQVLLPLGFWMGKYEVTQREYQKVTGNNPSWFKGDSSRPVEQVSWEDAVAYCARLTQMETVAGRLPGGFVYRLPTEAEFEYACRAGTTTRFSYGDDPDYSKLPEYAWFSENSDLTSHPVGQKKPNAFGLYDMHGNVWEWCSDWYYFYAGEPVVMPSGPLTGGTRIFRGGGWDYRASTCRSAYRNNMAPSQRRLYVGFRVVLAPVLQ
ncbi:MAG: formylglycine-generating enzyme family protein [Verrucomicrobia bacterium]|nr:formylglycine-generating enzyme family protein [Verrucomicrobiota bacterium]